MSQFPLAGWSTWFLVAAVALAGGWALMLWVVCLPGHQRPLRAQPESADLGPEPPAVAGMLTHGGRVGDEAAAATLLDLAARRVIDLEQAGSQPCLCRIRAAGDVELAPYERRILSYLNALATDGVVPAPALAEGVDRPAGWWRKLRGEVIADARARGLSRTRWRPGQAVALGLPAALPGAGLMIWLVSVTGVFPTLGSRGIVGGTIVAGLLGLALVRRLNTDRLTDTGRAAASHWLGVRAHLAADPAIASQPPAAVASYGRYLAYAAALGLARTATQSLPIGALANPRIGWSTYGNGPSGTQWHQVHISYSRRLNWGTAPRQMLTSRLLFAVPAAGVAFLFLAVIPGLPGIAWVALAVLALALAGAARAAADLTGARPVEGQVVRIRPVGRGSQSWLAVDDGTGSTVRAWRVDAPLRRQLSEGDVIRVRVSRDFGYVSGLQLVTHHEPAGVEGALPAWQREDDDRARRRAVLADDAPAWSAGSAPGLSLATLVSADDAAGLLGAPLGGPAGAPQALDPFGQIPGAAGNPLTRNAVLVACRWTSADGQRSADVYAGTGLGARSLLGQLVALADKTGRPERGGRLGPGTMLTGNVLVVAGHGMSAAVHLNDPDLPAARSALERFAPVLAERVASAGQGGFDQPAAAGRRAGQ